MEDEYVRAFRYIQTIVQQSNPKLFHLAHDTYKKIGRGAITLLYTQVGDVFESTGLAPAQYLPKAVLKAEDGQDVAKECDEYDPETQFIIVVTIGQHNNPDAEVLRNTFTVDYIGREGEEMMNKSTISLEEMDTRLEGKKSWKCDWCGQRRLLRNLMLDPVIGKLVYCDTQCYQNGWENGGRTLVEWYLKQKPAFGRPQTDDNVQLQLV